MRAGLEMRLLGPFEVRLEGGELASLGGLRQRALLAVLTLHANEVVSTDQLVDELWSERAPATAVHTVQVFVSRLRGALGPAGKRLTTRPSGYALEIASNEVDAGCCERLYSGARAALSAGDAEQAAGLLRDALALWRGPPLADFTYEPFAQATIARLEELRMSCREELIEAELALGRHAEVVAQLEALVREQPFRERPRGQLMLALYRSGRQVEALEAFQHARRVLVDELGVEPSPALRGLEQAILEQADALSAPPGPPDAQPPPTSKEARLPLADRPARPGIVRKTATVLVAQLEPTPDTDPERARTLVRAAREAAHAVITRHGGDVVAGLGGEIVAVFGLPATREDDVFRALHAADELRAPGEPSELLRRVGLDSGEVVAEPAGDLFGEPLARAIALVRTAADGEVVLSDATRRMASGGLEAERTGAGTGWRLVRAPATAPARSVLRVGSMVGRDLEMNEARAAFELAAARKETHLLTVVGEAGIGKSRLSDELVEELKGRSTVLGGRCLSYGDGTALWPFREALTSAAGGDSRDAIRTLLGDEEDADLVTDIVAAALGLGPAEQIGEQVHWAFRRLVETLAARAPVVLVIDDVHWAREPLLDLIDYLVDWLAAPVLVLCLGRPELLDQRPRWGGGHRRVKSVVLGALAEEDALRLLGSELAEGQLSDAEQTRILATAEGNPLFIEQLLAMSSEDPAWDQTGELPATLQALLAARLDRLGPGERGLIDRAAVIGRGFWPSAVIEMLPPEARPSADQHLRALVRRGLVRPDRSTLAHQEELRFHHILIRDVAYRLTPKVLRGELHEQFADWLARRAEGAEEFVGYHLEQAVEYRRELDSGSELAELARRAGESLVVAGRRSLARGDANASVSLLRRSAAMFELIGVARPDVLLDIGIALGESGRFEDAQHALTNALEQAREAGADAVRARVSIELVARRSLVDPSTRAEEMLAVAQGAIGVFSRLGDESGLARAWEQVALVHWIGCRCGEMEKVLERAREHAERAGDQLERSRILGELASAMVFGPRPAAEGIQRCTAILGLAQGDVRLTSITEVMLAVLEAMQGDFDAARDHWMSTKRRLEQVGLGVTLSGLTMYRAFIELMAGTPENARAEIVAACVELERAGVQDRLATVAALLARILYAEARYDEAEHYTAISEACASDDDVGSQILWQGTRAMARARAGDVRAAEDLATSAVALATKGDLLMLQADALTDRAEVLSLLNRPEAAIRDLDEAIVLYERKGLLSRLDAARRLRGSLMELTGPAGSAAPA